MALLLKMPPQTPPQNKQTTAVLELKLKSLRGQNVLRFLLWFRNYSCWAVPFPYHIHRRPLYGRSTTMLRKLFSGAYCTYTNFRQKLFSLPTKNFTIKM